MSTQMCCGRTGTTLAARPASGVRAVMAQQVQQLTAQVAGLVQEVEGLIEADPVAQMTADVEQLSAALDAQAARLGVNLNPGPGDEVHPALIDRLYLTPKRPDGSGGELIAELKRSRSERQFMAPCSPWDNATHEEDVEALRRELDEIERELTRTSGWAARTRLEARAGELRRRLADADLDRRVRAQPWMRDHSRGAP